MASWALRAVHEFFHSGIGAVATARASGAGADGPAPFAVKR